MTSYVANAINSNTTNYPIRAGWHTTPGMYASGSVTFTRSAENVAKVTYSGTISTTMTTGGTGNAANRYGFPITYRLKKGEAEIESGTIHDYNNGGNASYDYNTYSKSISGSFTLDDNLTDITLHYYCNFNMVEGGCNVGCADVVTFKLPAGKLNYNPYTAPSYKINSITPDPGNHKTTSFNVNYSITDGTNDLTSVKAVIYNTSNEEIGTFALSNSKGSSLDGKFTLGDSYKDGMEYLVGIRLNDGKGTYNTSKLSFRTYRYPIINSLSIPSNFSGIGGVDISYNTNTRRWDLDKETYFKTYLSINNRTQKLIGTNEPSDQRVQNTTTSISTTLTKSLIDDILTKEDRSVPVLKTTLSVIRENESGKIQAKATQNVEIQFAPKYAPTNLKFYNYETGAVIPADSMIYLDECPTIRVDWSYPNLKDGGVVDGYIVKVYENSSYSTVKTTTVVDSHSNNTRFNTRTELKRGTLNYITVTAFYTKPDGTGTIEGPTIKSAFVLPIGKLYPPKVPYPVDNCMWHNNKFRILCELPYDDDEDVLNLSTYKYKDIELVINNKSYLFSEYPNIFSTSTLSYRKKICINPSLITDFPLINKYEIKIRVQKNYFVNIWSQYSTLTVNVEPITNLDIVKGEYIMAGQYKYVRSSSIRLWESYPINILPTNNQDKNKYDIIYYKNYQAIYDTIKQIQNDINTWCAYDTDRFNIKLNEIIDTFDLSEKAKQEIITAMDDARPSISGRNYKNLLINCMNKLK